MTCWKPLFIIIFKEGIELVDDLLANEWTWYLPETDGDNDNKCIVGIWAKHQPCSNESESENANIVKPTYSVELINLLNYFTSLFNLRI